jgi:hypothetical protein
LRPLAKVTWLHRAVTRFGVPLAVDGIMAHERGRGDPDLDVVGPGAGQSGVAAVVVEEGVPQERQVGGDERAAVLLDRDVDRQPWNEPAVGGIGYGHFQVHGRLR